VSEAKEIEGDPHTTAIHEAGHAVIHHLLGNQITYVNIRPSGNARQYGYGYANVTYRGYWYETAILGCFAGPWAHKLFTDDTPTQIGCRDDFREITRILDLCKLDEPERVALRERLKEQSRAMVIANEKSIRVVADYLIAHGELGNPAHSDGQTATEILNRLIGRNLPEPPEPAA
jgi:hypothetical protein